jgi:four helix bundle protein
MRRAAISIPSNIAEGFSRFGKKEYRRFLSISLGSCTELETQVIIAKRRNYINEDESVRLEELINYECKMILNMLKLLE